jgi:hypothetical protein
MNFDALIARSREMLSLTTLSLNSTALSIASLRYNPTPAHSDYIDYLLGGRAIHIDTNFRDYKSTGMKLDVFEERYPHYLEHIRSRVNASHYLQRPKCSLELLGYSLLEVHEPFSSRKRLEKPAIGYGEVMFYGIHTVGDLRVDCIYRGLFEHWLPENPDFGPNYWSTIFFCPLKRQSDCDAIRTNEGHRGNPIIKFKLDMKVNENVTWTSDFQARIRPAYLNPLKKAPTVAVCTVIPYTSIDEEKIIANAAIFNAWIEYYLHLGFAVIVYDRDGETYRQSVNRSYDFLRNEANSAYLKNLIYHDFTILTKIRPELVSDYRYDNIAQSADYGLSLPFKELFRLHRRRWRSSKPPCYCMLFYIWSEHHATLDHDKQLSFTHCRFEARAILGIERTVIVDFDEFLFCPPAKPTYTAQRMFLEKVMHMYESSGLHQLTFQQRIMNNKTDSVRDCLIEKAKAHASIFDCYSSNKFVAGTHAEKSIHLKHVCPMTGYHTACPNERSNPFTHDCQCNSEFLRGEVCSFVHIVTNQQRLHKKNWEAEIPIIRADESDIKKIMASRDDQGGQVSIEF